MSATRSASGGRPYLNPKLMIVTRVPRGALVGEQLDDLRRELVDVEVGGVDDDVGALADAPPGASRSSADAVEDRAVALQRVRAAHRLEPAHEHVVGGVEEHRRARWRRSRSACDDASGSSANRSRPRTSTTTATRGSALAGELGEVEQRSQHLRRQVVDDVPAEVLERVRRRRAARAGHAGDDEHLAGARAPRHRLGAPLRRPTLQPIGHRRTIGVRCAMDRRGELRARRRAARRSPRASPRLSAATEPKWRSSALMRASPSPGTSASTL